MRFIVSVARALLPVLTIGVLLMNVSVRGARSECRVDLHPVTSYSEAEKQVQNHLEECLAQTLALASQGGCTVTDSEGCARTLYVITGHGRPWVPVTRHNTGFDGDASDQDGETLEVTSQEFCEAKQQLLDEIDPTLKEAANRVLTRRCCDTRFRLFSYMRRERDFGKIHGMLNVAAASIDAHISKLRKLARTESESDARTAPKASFCALAEFDEDGTSINDGAMAVHISVCEAKVADSVLSQVTSHAKLQEVRAEQAILERLFQLELERPSQEYWPSTGLASDAECESVHIPFPVPSRLRHNDNESSTTQNTTQVPESSDEPPKKRRRLLTSGINKEN